MGIIKDRFKTKADAANIEIKDLLKEHGTKKIRQWYEGDLSKEGDCEEGASADGQGRGGADDREESDLDGDSGRRG